MAEHPFYGAFPILWKRDFLNSRLSKSPDLKSEFQVGKSGEPGPPRVHNPISLSLLHWPKQFFIFFTKLIYFCLNITNSIFGRLFEKNGWGGAIIFGK